MYYIQNFSLFKLFWEYDIEGERLNLQNGSCVKLGGKCTGLDFKNATLIPGDDKNLETDVKKTLVVNDTSKKCEWKCKSGYMYQNWKCISIARKCEIWAQNEQERSCIIDWIQNDLFRVRILGGENWEDVANRWYTNAEQDYQMIFQDCDSYAKNYEEEAEKCIPDNDNSSGEGWEGWEGWACQWITVPIGEVQSFQRPVWHYECACYNNWTCCCEEE